MAKSPYMEGMAYPSPSIANEFLKQASEAEQPLTAMQLQKLCYLSHGFSLALFDKPFTNDKIEAWDYGPVYPDLYDAVKRYGGAPIAELIHQSNWAEKEEVRGPVMKADLSADERELTETVWKDYGSFEAFQLSALTHEDDSPWAKVYRPGQRNLVIEDSLIKSYFLDLTNAESPAVG